MHLHNIAAGSLGIIIGRLHFWTYKAPELVLYVVVTYHQIFCSVSCVRTVDSESRIHYYNGDGPVQRMFLTSLTELSDTARKIGCLASDGTQDSVKLPRGLL